jgi:hypothetical protein
MIVVAEKVEDTAGGVGVKMGVVFRTKPSKLLALACLVTTCFAFFHVGCALPRPAVDTYGGRKSFNWNEIEAQQKQQAGMKLLCPQMAR